MKRALAVGASLGVVGFPSTVKRMRGLPLASGILEVVPAAVTPGNARMRANRIPESATFPPEQERLYGYDAEAVLRDSAA